MLSKASRSGKRSSVATVTPPLEPMLGRLARELPRGGYLYEPKWDGFRCLAFREGPEVDLRSRHGRPLARYFPELVEALGELAGSFVLDGEVLVLRDGELDFEALMRRLHPAERRVERLRAETPASYVAFDLLAIGGEDLLEVALERRRAELERTLSGIAPPLYLTPATRDPDRALAWLERSPAGGIDGVMAKRLDGPYRPGARTMVKVKRERTADCVVGGFRVYAGEPVVASLLLGLYDEAGELHHIGVASSFSESRRRELFEELAPLATDLAGHPWERGFLLGGGSMGRLPGAAASWTPALELDWVPIRLERVCEIAFDQVDDSRLRHPGRFRRWRPDRDPRSCKLDQLEAGKPLELLG
jgi:ATP-dependent DNA ligase